MDAFHIKYVYEENALTLNIKIAEKNLGHAIFRIFRATHVQIYIYSEN